MVQPTQQLARKFWLRVGLRETQVASSVVSRGQTLLAQALID